MSIPKLITQLLEVPITELLTQPRKIMDERERCAQLLSEFLANEISFRRELKEARGRERRLEKLLFQRGAMLQAPCFICGYQKGGYFQPEQHPCATRHHRYYKEAE